MNPTVYVQLGWLQTAVNWVYQHSLKPVFDVMSTVISTIIKGLFEYILLPILETVFGIQIELFKTILMNMIYNQLFRLTRVVMWALDAVENAFRTFAGLNPVYLQDERGAMQESGSLLTALFQSGVIRGALLGMILISFVLCFLTAIFATIRAIGDLGGNDGKIRSVSHVLRLTGRAMGRLILIPLMGLFFVTLGDAILISIETATNAEHVAVSDILFTMSTLDAVRDDVPDKDAEYYNSSTRVAALAGLKGADARKYSDYGLKDKYRRDYYYGRPVDGAMGVVKEFFGSGDTKKRTVMAEVLETFDIRRIDYFIAIGGTILFIYLFGTMAVTMISRIFDCLLLLMVEPFFAATMPLDEGKKFDTWQETFLGRLISGYGTVVAMNLYLQIIAMVFEGKIAFFGEGTTPAVDYLTRILFVLMGAYAITQAGPVVTGIMSAPAATREKQMMTQGGVLSRTAMGLVTAPGRYVASRMWNRGVDQLSENVSDLVGNFSLTNGGNPHPGIGDAFGKLSGNGPEGVAYQGKKIDNGNGVSIQNGSGNGTGPGGAPFSGKKGENGSVAPVVGTGLSGALNLPGAGEGGGQQFTQSNKPQDFVNPAGGLDVPLDGPKPGTFDFLNPPAQEPGYTWIGQRDQEEREEKKKYEELLGTELEEDALLAAESETGMDLNGDGLVTGSKGDDDDGDIPLNRKDGK